MLSLSSPPPCASRPHLRACLHSSPVCASAECKLRFSTSQVDAWPSKCFIMVLQNGFPNRSPRTQAHRCAVMPLVSLLGDARVTAFSVYRWFLYQEQLARTLVDFLLSGVTFHHQIRDPPPEGQPLKDPDKKHLAGVRASLARGFLPRRASERSSRSCRRRVSHAFEVACRRSDFKQNLGSRSCEAT